jgi:hypothetical protein
MVCVCGARLPVDNPSSCCDHCLGIKNDYDSYDWDTFDGQGEW